MRVPATSRTVRAASSILLAVTLTVPVGSQGRIANAKIEARRISQTLEREVQAIADRAVAVWIGYRTPMIPGRRHMCCYDSIATTGDCCGACRLESGGGVTMTQGGGVDLRGSRITLEPPADVLILARIEGGAVTRLRTFTPDCDLDADAMPLVWLENVAPSDSIAWLTALTRAAAGASDRENRVVQPAIGALAIHPGQAALGTLVALARNDGRTAVRSQALFWLSQRAGQEAAATITGAIADDPETEVKRRAVFALSQLPKDEGIPLLITVARTNRNAEVRKQAMFWLGQSKDPRAVGFFEEVLKLR